MEPIYHPLTRQLQQSNPEINKTTISYKSQSRNLALSSVKSYSISTKIQHFDSCQEADGIQSKINQEADGLQPEIKSHTISI